MSAIVLTPFTVTDASLDSSNIPEPDTGETVYSAATDYAIGDEVISTVTHRVYTALAANGPATTVVDPTTDDGTTWRNSGPTNRYAMFDEENGTASTQATEIVVVITPGQVINGIAGFNVDASTINVTATDPIDGEFYNTDVTMRDTSRIIDYYTYCYEPITLIDRFALLDIPSRANATFTITISGTEASIGNLSLGRQNSIGESLMGTGLSGQDFSVVNFDEFGTFNYTRRQTTDRVELDIVVPRDQTNYFRAVIRDVRGRLTTWSGGTGEVNDPTLVFGFYDDFNITLETKRQTFGTLTIRGVI